jgi:large subunit ribosomal protein L29
MKPNEIRRMTRSEIEQLLGDREEEFSNLRLQAVTQELENPLLIRQVRRDMARLRTILREDELGIVPLS